MTLRSFQRTNTRLALLPDLGVVRVYLSVEAVLQAVALQATKLVNADGESGIVKETATRSAGSVQD